MDIATVASWLAYIVATLCLSSAPQQDAEADLAAAEAFYWAALADDSDPVLLELGSSRLEGLLAREDEVGERARALEADLRHQIDMAHDTLRGVFPAYRFLVEGPRNEAFVDDPWILAAVRSAQKLVEAIEAHGVASGQYSIKADFRGGGSAHVPSTSRALENEIHAVLSTSSRLWLDPRPASSDEQRVGELVATGESMGNSAPLWGVQIDATLVENGSGKVSEVRAFGFALDQRSHLLDAVGVLLVLLSLATGRLLFTAIRRGQDFDKLLAGLIAWGFGGMFALVAPRLAADWLVSPAEILATGLGSVIFVALAALAGVPVLLSLGRLRFGESLDLFIPHWKRPESGVWPAMIGGGGALLAVTSIEGGLATAAPAALAWLVIVRCVCEVLERPDRPRARALVVTVLGVIAATALADHGFDLGGTTITRALWLALPVVTTLAAWIIGSAPFAYAIAGIATVGLLASATLPLWTIAFSVLVVEAFGLRFRRSSPGRSGASTTERAVDADRAVFAALGLEPGARHELDSWYGGNSRWDGLELVKGARGDRVAVAQALVLEWGLSKVDFRRVECSEDSDGGLRDLRALVSGREHMGAALRDVAASFAGDVANALPEQERLIDTLLSWFERGDGGAAKVLLLIGHPGRELTKILNKAEKVHRSKPKGRRVRVITIGDDSSVVRSKGQSPGTSRKAISIESSVNAYRERVLEVALRLERVLAEEVARRASIAGARLEFMISAVQHLKDEGVFHVDDDGLTLMPIERDKDGVFARLEQALALSGTDQEQDLLSISDSQRALLQAAALQGSSFDLELVAAVGGVALHHVAAELARTGVGIEDLDRDGWMKFTDLEDRYTILRGLQMVGERGQVRWRQVALDMLRVFIIREVERGLEGGAADGEGLWSALRFSEQALRHGASQSRTRAAMEGLWGPLIERAELTWRAPEDAGTLLEGALSHELVPSDLSPSIYALTLRIEDARRSRAYLASDERVESVERAASALLSEGWESDPGRRDAALEIACRWITLDMAEGSESRVGSREILDGVLTAEGASGAQKGRAHYEIARLEFLAVKTKPDPSGRYPEALERFSTAARLLRDADDLPILVRVLRTHAEALGIPPQGVDRASVEARADLLDEALELTASLGDERGIAMIEGTYGRLYQYEATLPENPLDPEARAQYLAQAHHYFDLDLQRAKRLNDLDGVIHMTTSLAQVAWSAGQFDEARAGHLEADELLTRTQGQDMGRSRAFALLGLLAEARRTNSIEERTLLEERLAACSPLPPLPDIEEYFRPHLDGVESIWN